MPQHRHKIPSKQVSESEVPFHSSVAMICKTVYNDKHDKAKATKQTHEVS